MKEDEKEKHVEVEETAGAEEPEDGPRTATKGGWVPR